MKAIVFNARNLVNCAYGMFIQFCSMFMPTFVNVIDLKAQLFYLAAIYCNRTLNSFKLPQMLIVCTSQFLRLFCPEVNSLNKQL